MSELIGLDIGSHSIKVVGMKMTSKGPLLTYSETKRIPPDRKGDPDFIAQTLRSLWSEGGLKETESVLPSPEKESLSAGSPCPPCRRRNCRRPCAGR